MAYLQENAKFKMNFDKKLWKKDFVDAYVAEFTQKSLSFHPSPLGHPEEYSPMHPGRGHSTRPGPQLDPGLPPGHGLCGADGGSRQHYQQTEEIISLWDWEYCLNLI